VERKEEASQKVKCWIMLKIMKNIYHSDAGTKEDIIPWKKDNKMMFFASK